MTEQTDTPEAEETDPADDIDWRPEARRIMMRSIEAERIRRGDFLRIVHTDAGIRIRHTLSVALH